MPKNTEKTEFQYQKGICLFFFFLIFRTTILCLHTFLHCVHHSGGKAVLWSSAQQQCVKCQGLIWICSGMWQGTEVLNPVKMEAKRGALHVPCRVRSTISKTITAKTALLFSVVCELKTSLLHLVTFWVFKFIHRPQHVCLCLYLRKLIQDQPTPYFLSTVLACYMAAYWVKLPSNWMHHILVCCLYGSGSLHWNDLCTHLACVRVHFECQFWYKEP